MAAAYNSQRPESNPTPLFALIPQALRHRKRLNAEVTRALASIKPWVWSYSARLARTWSRNPNHDQGQHSKERGEREARLRENLERLKRRNWYARLCESPGVYKLAGRAVVLEARRLVTTGEWCKLRERVDRRTGELVQEHYLPEDTWAAAHLLDWCVSFLERLAGSVAGMTEKVTRAYKPWRPTTVDRGAGRGFQDESWLRELQRRWGERGAGQSELPATT